MSLELSGLYHLTAVFVLRVYSLIHCEGLAARKAEARQALSKDEAGDNLKGKDGCALQQVR
jgi:hypothetical protein